MDYRVQRLKEDLTNAQQRNKKQRIQLANYKRVHEKDLEIIKKYKEVIDKAMLYINSTKYSDITGLEKHSIKEFWFIEELLEILKGSVVDE